MALPPPPPRPAGTPVPPPPGSAPAAPARKEPEIVVIPEKFYGMALKMKSDIGTEPPKPPAPPPKPVGPPPPGPIKKRSVWPFVGVGILLVLLIGGGFLYFNWNLLFPPPTPPVVTPEPEPVPVPSAPANLTATAASGTLAVALSWVDTSADETGYRIERREGSGTYLPLTSLSINSATFLDVTVQSERVYSYRVIAVGPGGESSPSNEATVTTPSISAPVTATLPPGGLDSDSDGLTDLEEGVYGTDIRNPDSDGDGFLDGNEVFHLYNPAATAPVRLLDSGIVQELRASSGWSFYVPVSWTSTLTPPDGVTATIRTGEGETFQVEIEDNPENLGVREWYLRENPGTSAASIRTITTKGGLQGIVGPDHLSAHFAWDGKIFSLRYELNGRPFINFRTTFEMMLNSLKLPGAPILTGPAAGQLEGPGDFVETSPATSTEGATSTPSATSSAP